MTPVAVETQTLLQTLHPKQHGPYLVTLHPEWEITLFYALSSQVHDPVWAVEVSKIVLDLNEGTANELRDPEGEVKLTCTFVPNKWPVELTNAIIFGAAGVAKLTPVLP